MLPDAEKMIGDIPGALKGTVLDASGIAHDCVSVQTDFAVETGDYGLTRNESGYAVYVAQPYIAPDAKTTITRGNGAPERRRVVSAQNNPVFVVLTLGEVCR